MRAIRELPIVAPLLLVGFALFFGGGPADGSVPWLGAGALLGILLLLALNGVPGGATALVPLLALAAWCAISIDWSWLPDHSWDYANRTLLYVLAAAAGLWAAGRTRALANGFAVVLAAVLAWSLLGKVLPPVYDYGSLFATARLTGPIGLWNQLALAADYALVLGLWRRGRSGTLLVYLALVTLLLTYSRGGVLTAVVVAAAWFAFADERIDSAASLAAGLVPAAVVGGLSFLLPGIAKGHQSLHVRWRDGIVFGVMLLAGAAASLVLERVPRPRDTRALRVGLLTAGAVLGVAAIVFLVVRGIGSTTVSNGSSRFTSTSSNFRFTWWHEAWRAFSHHVLVGTGAGSFQLVNLLYRATYLDTANEPHDLPLQMLSELGVIGLALFVASMALLLRGSLRRRGHELALALLLPAFLVHSLVDVDWDFAAVAIPAFVAAGALVGRPARERAPFFALMPAVGIALLAFCSLLLPWLGNRWSLDAIGAWPARAVTLAKRAHSVDPLLYEPYWAQAQAADTRGKTQLAFSWYVAAVHRQPKNPYTWRAAGEYAWTNNCPYLAYDYLLIYTELDQKALPSEGGDDYNAALKRVDHHRYTC